MHIDASVLALTLQPSLNDFWTTALMHTPVAAPLARSYCHSEHHDNKPAQSNVNPFAMRRGAIRMPQCDAVPGRSARRSPGCRPCDCHQGRACGGRTWTGRRALTRTAASARPDSGESSRPSHTGVENRGSERTCVLHCSCVPGRRPGHSESSADGTATVLPLLSMHLTERRMMPPPHGREQLHATNQTHDSVTDRAVGAAQ
jgi:hypothetical protein